MEGLFAVLVGALAIAAAPLVPVIRPVAKAAVLGGLALADAAASAASAASQQIDQLRSHNVIDATVSAVGEGAAVTATTATTAVADKVSVIGGGASTADTTLVKGESEAIGKSEVIEDIAAESVAFAAEETYTATADTEEDAGPDNMVAVNDNLTLINGIGPKVATILNTAGITTFAQLAATNEEQLRIILDNAGARYRAMNPASWPAQASQFLASKEDIQL
jgi:predicted flap endonuclease-1-like 5' DNA nuclease